MRIQLSDKRIIKDAVTVWSHPGPEVDIVMDLENLTFRQGSVSEIFAFHVIDHLFQENAQRALNNWHQCLSKGGALHLLNDDFEYVARAFVGGDIDIEVFNSIHNHPFQCIQTNVVDMLIKSGFKDNEVVIWYEGHPGEMTKKHYEFILTATKNG